MSTATARPLPRHQPAAPAPAATPAPRPRLAVVHAPDKARTRAPFVITCMLIIAASLLTALFLNTSMARTSYAISDLDRKIAQQAQDERDLSASLDQKSSPYELANAAAALGMVPAPPSAWLRLSDGAVLGTPTVAKP